MHQLSICLLISLVFVACAVDHIMDEDLQQPVQVHMALAKPINRAQRCMDVYTQCKQWAKRGACQSSRYTREAKRALCGISCKLCKPEELATEPSAEEEQLTKTMEGLVQPVSELVNNLNDIVKLGKQTLESLAKQGEPASS